MKITHTTARPCICTMQTERARINRMVSYPVLWMILFCLLFRRASAECYTTDAHIQNRIGFDIT